MIAEDQDFTWSARFQRMPQRLAQFYRQQDKKTMTNYTRPRSLLRVGAQLTRNTPG
jgi:hypothetical protein